MNSSTPKPDEIDTLASSDESLAQPLDERWLAMIDTALKVQAPLAASYVASLRKKKPKATDDELMDMVCSRFLNLMTATGAGVGGVAALPGIGTIAAMGLTIGEGVSFAEACAFLTLSAAAIHEVDMKDSSTRRLVMLAVLAGERGEEIIAKSMGKKGVSWENVLAGGNAGMVQGLISQQISRYVRRRLMAKAGGLWLGRLLPFGVGAIIGGIGARIVAGSVIEAVRDIFSEVDVVESTTVEGELEN